MMKFASLLSLGLVGALTAGAAPAAPAAPRTTVSQQSCDAQVVADESDNGSSVCVVLGSDVSILLHTVAGSPWSSPTVTGRVLGPAMPLPTPFGRVGWQFRTIAAGRAEIRITRPTGPSSAASATDCHTAVYRLHVTVR